MCDNKGVKCMAKRTVYQVECKLCNEENVLQPDMGFSISPEDDGSNSNDNSDRKHTSPVGDGSNSNSNQSLQQQVAAIASSSSSKASTDDASYEFNLSSESDDASYEFNLGSENGSNSSTGDVSYEFNLSQGNDESNSRGIYVGESARHVGARILEHVQNLNNWNKQSFMLKHWMMVHGTNAQAPEFNFKILATHKDALSRQINEAVHIRARGDMNCKQEFASNELIRLESKKYSWEERKLNEMAREKEKRTRQILIILFL